MNHVMIVCQFRKVKPMQPIQVYIVCQAKKSPASVALLTYRGHHKIVSAQSTATRTETLTLTALIRALHQLKRHDLPVIIHTAVATIRENFNQQKYAVWQQNNWKTDQEPPVDVALWRQLIPLTQQFPDLSMVNISQPTKDSHYLLARSALAASQTHPQADH